MKKAAQGEKFRRVRRLAVDLPESSLRSAFFQRTLSARVGTVTYSYLVVCPSSFRSLCAVHDKLYSPETFFMPRSRNCRICWDCLLAPNTGSATCHLHQ